MPAVEGTGPSGAGRPEDDHGISRVCVIGAGVMGAGIAAHVANAGCRVLLLDIPAGNMGGPDDDRDRDGLARTALARMLRTEPSPFMSPEAADLVEVGNVEDDLGGVGVCDWIIEAIVEDVASKQALYRCLQAVRRPGTAISSNTSTIPLARLVSGLPDALSRDFMITHFFNPPRFMRLLELVTGPGTDAALADRIARFCDLALGKTVVRARDTPGFIANRLGTFWMQQGVNEAIGQGLTVEQADAVLGRPFGIPRTGIFGLHDLVGLDLMPHIGASLRALLPAADPLLETLRDQPLLARMIADGRTGRKGRGGFYRFNREAGSRESVSLATGEYGPSGSVGLPPALRDPRALIASDDRLGRYAWSVMGPTLAYATGLVPAVADDVVAVDAAMRLGFNWTLGPFELLDRLGPAAVARRLAGEGRPVPALLAQVGDNSFYKVEDGELLFLGVDGSYRPVLRPDGVLLLADIRRRTQPLLRNASAALWDIGEGVACFEPTSKMNAVDDRMLSLLGRSIELVGQRFRAMVIHSDAENFSVGADLGQVLFSANIAAWGELERLLSTGQDVFKRLKYAAFPVVAAPAGLALGGGCEMLLHADAIQAHADAAFGLVECGVGLVPGWGGCGEMLLRWSDAPAPPQGRASAAAKVFALVGAARVARSAAEAKALRFLRDGDGVTMNRDRLLFDARRRALSMVDGYAPPGPPAFELSGSSGRALMAGLPDSGRQGAAAPEHDLTVAGALAELLSGGTAGTPGVVTEAELLALERCVFMRLVRTGPTLARIEHMLDTGKPLRN